MKRGDISRYNASHLIIVAVETKTLGVVANKTLGKTPWHSRCSTSICDLNPEP